MIENVEIAKYLARSNGPSQDIFVLEEMAELQKELMKHRRGKNNVNEIVDESCDVLLTVYILLLAYGTSDEEISKHFSFKLNRLRDMLPSKEVN